MNEQLEALTGRKGLYTTNDGDAIWLLTWLQKQPHVEMINLVTVANQFGISVRINIYRKKGTDVRLVSEPRKSYATAIAEAVIQWSEYAT